MDHLRSKGITPKWPKHSGLGIILICPDTSHSFFFFTCPLDMSNWQAARRRMVGTLLIQDLSNTGLWDASIFFRIMTFFRQKSDTDVCEKLEAATVPPFTHNPAKGVDRLKRRKIFSGWWERGKKRGHF